MHSRHLLSTSTFILAAAGLLLSACNKPAAEAPDPAPVAGLAPDAAQLPASGTIRPASAGVVRQPYRYIDDAYALGDAFGDGPPDYTIDYEGTHPLIWRSRNGDYRVIEQTADGDRDYYYRAGADQPFLVRDPRYAYAYDGGALVVIYDASGRPLTQAITARDADVAARYLNRARQLHVAAIGQPRLSAATADWAAQGAAVQAQRRQWAADRQRNDDWRRWHTAQAPRERASYDAERVQRRDDAARFAGLTTGVASQRSQDQAEAQQRREQAQGAATGQRQEDLRNDAARRAQAMAQSRADQPQQRAEAKQRIQTAAQDYRRGQDDAAQAQRRQMQAEQGRAPPAQAVQAKPDQVRVQPAQAVQAKRVQAQAAAGRDRGKAGPKGDKAADKPADKSGDKDKRDDRQP